MNWEAPIDDRAPVDLLWLQADLADVEATQDVLFRRVDGTDHPIDGVIHCAGTYGSNSRHRFDETSCGEWEELFAVNARARFLVTKCLLPVLLARPAALIMAITSDVATGSGAGRVAYASSHAAAYKLFVDLAEELHGSSVSVVQVRPVQQVVTPGLRRRRPPDQNFNGYTSAGAFARSVMPLVDCLGRGYHGKCIEIE
jgi:NAD(P)-dependent dehydrogenase (short-subunit alcohol dehydrogenase family)